MNIIQKQPNESGSYGQVYHSFSGVDPNAYYEIISDMTDYYTWNGFIIPTIENDAVTSYACNTEAWEAWKAWQAAHQPLTPQPTTEEKLAAFKRSTDATISVMSAVIDTLLA